MLGAPGWTRTAHVMLFGPVGMERRDDELLPEGADFADQSDLVIVAAGGRRCGGCHGAFVLPVARRFSLEKIAQNRCKGSVGGID